MRSSSSQSSAFKLTFLGSAYVVVALVRFPAFLLGHGGPDAESCATMVFMPIYQMASTAVPEKGLFPLYCEPLYFNAK